MYLYYDKQGKLQTAIAHGSPVRQGDSFGLYVCFDLDYFNANKKFVGEEGFCYTYKRPGDSGLTGPIDFDSSSDSKDGYLGAKKFVKLYDSEITYKLIDNKKYLTFYTNVPSNLDGFTAKNGEVEVQFTFKTINENQQVDTTVLTANIYVEPTYKKDNYVLDETLAARTNFEQVMASIAQLRAEKNIALLELDHNVANTDEYATLQDRANEIFSTWVYTRIGWVLIGAKRDITQTVEDIAPTSIEHINTDLFIILDGKNNYDENEQLVSTVGNIFAVDSETGLMWNYEITLDNHGNLINSVPTQLTYNKEYFDMLLGDLRGFLNEVDNGKPYYTNLTVGLRDFLDRIKHIENNAVYKVSYSSSTGKFTYHEGNNLLDTDKERDIVDNDTLRTDLGIKNIENNAVFDVEYTKPYLKVKKGLNGEKQTILTTSNVIQNEEYVATVKAVYDTLEKAATNEANSNTEVFNGLMRKISYISQFFFEGADADDKVNKLEEVLEILKNIPENYDIYSLLTNIYDKIGEQFEDSYFYNPEWSAADKAANSIKGKIQFLQQNTDRHIVIIMRYSEGNQEFFTLGNWIQLEEENEIYPEATCYTTLQNDVFKNAVDMEVVFDKTVEQGYVLGSELDTDSGTLTIYVLEEPEETLTIDTIKIISNVFHTTNISVDALNQIVTNRINIAANTADINNLTRDKVNKVEVEANNVTGIEREGNGLLGIGWGIDIYARENYNSSTGQQGGSGLCINPDAFAIFQEYLVRPNGPNVGTGYIARNEIVADAFNGMKISSNRSILIQKETDENDVKGVAKIETAIGAGAPDYLVISNESKYSDPNYIDTISNVTLGVNQINIVNKEKGTNAKKRTSTIYFPDYINTEAVNDQGNYTAFNLSPTSVNLAKNDAGNNSLAGISIFQDNSVKLYSSKIVFAHPLENNTNIGDYYDTVIDNQGAFMRYMTADDVESKAIAIIDDSETSAYSNATYSRAEIDSKISGVVNAIPDKIYKHNMILKKIGNATRTCLISFTLDTTRITNDAPINSFTLLYNTLISRGYGDDNNDAPSLVDDAKILHASGMGRSSYGSFVAIGIAAYNGKIVVYGTTFSDQNLQQRMLEIARSEYEEWTITDNNPHY